MPLVPVTSQGPLDLPSLSATRRPIQAIALLIALLLAASVADGPARGLVWLFHPSPAVQSKVDPGLDRTAATVPVIVQGRTGGAAAVAATIVAAGGQLGAPLPLIDGFSATIAGTKVDQVARSEAVQAITANRAGRYSQAGAEGGAGRIASSFPSSTGATAAWQQDDRGEGVGVAVIDTGVSPVPDLASRVVYGPDLSGEGSLIDTYGHGTVMAGLIAGSGADSATEKKGAYVGMAPRAHLVAVKAAGASGATDIATILRAMQWVSAYRSQLGIRVLNLSWGTASTQSSALDPLRYAVERLWDEGIVVVVAAGNAGPGPSTVTSPGDDPAVLTAGAYDDRGDANPRNDTVPAWSSRGTVTGPTKPDLVAPGRTLVSTRSFGSTVEAGNPSALVGTSYIKGSGTSQAAAVTSGAVALLLAAHPAYTPDQVKAVLKGSASPLPGAGPGATGAGRLQLPAALTADPGPARWQPTPATAAGSPAGSPSAWTGGSWTGGSWTGGSWTGGSWTGGSWTGGSWTGGSWTGGSWTGGSWTGGSWTGGSWTGGSWTGGSWTSAFWGDRPGAGHALPGETSDPPPSSTAA